MTGDGPAFAAAWSAKLRNELTHGYTLETVAARSLSLERRADVHFKVAFAAEVISGSRSHYTENAYVEHLRAINGLFENDASGKSGRAAFVDSFETLVSSMASHGFDDNAPIATNREGELLDGAHRLAVARVLDLDVLICRIQTRTSHSLGRVDLRKLGLQETLLDESLRVALSHTHNARFAFLWPRAGTSGPALFSELCDSMGISTLARVNLQLNEMQSFELIRLLYLREPWLGTSSNGFAGVRAKRDMCFPSREGFVEVRCIIASEAEAETLKGAFRSRLTYGKHAVHINDDADDLFDLGAFVLHSPTRQFYSSRIRSDYKWFSELTKRFRESSVDGRPFVQENTMLDGSSVQAAYGLREVRDLDVIASDPSSVIVSREIGLRDHVQETYGHTVPELLHDPRHFFIFRGLKFVSLQLTIEMKRARAEAKDLADLPAMLPLLQGRHDRYRRINWWRLHPRSITSRFKSRAVVARYRASQIKERMQRQ